MHGLSRQELAGKVGVNYQTIGFIERGDYSPSLELAFAVAAVFQVRVDDIFSDTEFKPLLGRLEQ
jgi:DNA-binding XRE family transcriptional regulator